mgnify:CR=1 FL=1
MRGETATPQDEVSSSIRVLAAALLERADALGPPGSLHGIVGMGLESQRSELDAELSAHPRLDDLHRLVLAQRLRALATTLPDDPEVLARTLRDTLAPSLELMGVEPIGEREPAIAERLEVWREAGLVDDALAESLREFDETVGEATRWAAYAPWTDRTRRVVRERVGVILDAQNRVPDAAELLGTAVSETLTKLGTPSSGNAIAGLDGLAEIESWARVLVAVEGDVDAVAGVIAMLDGDQADSEEVARRVATMLRLAESRDAPLPGAASVPRLLRPAHIEFVAEFRRLASLLDREIGLVPRPDYQGEASANGIAAAMDRERETLERLTRAGRSMTKPSDRETATGALEPIARQILQATRPVQRAKTRGERVVALEALRLLINTALPHAEDPAIDVFAGVMSRRHESPVLTQSQASAITSILTGETTTDGRLHMVVFNGLIRLIDDAHHVIEYLPEAADARVRLAGGRFDCAIAWSTTTIDTTIATPTEAALRAVLEPAGNAQAHRLTLTGLIALAARPDSDGTQHQAAGIGTLLDMATLVVPARPSDRTAWLGEIEFLRYAAEACVTDSVSPAMLRHLEDVVPTD